MLAKGDRMRITLPFGSARRPRPIPVLVVRLTRCMDADHSANLPNHDSVVPKDVYVAVTSVTVSAKKFPCYIRIFYSFSLHIFKRASILKAGFRMNCPLLPTLPSARIRGGPTTKRLVRVHISTFVSVPRRPRRNENRRQKSQGVCPLNASCKFCISKKCHRKR